METTAGSWALLGSVAPRDAFVVRRLREAGALLLGKAALSEWADMRSNNYSEGYSARGGQCRSAFNLTVNPGGSSSGSGVAVGANLVPFALGTETDGSGTFLVWSSLFQTSLTVTDSDKSSAEKCCCWYKAYSGPHITRRRNP